MTVYVALLFLVTGVRATPPQGSGALNALDVQIIERDVLTRPADPVTAADVDRLIEVLFKIGARIEGTMNGSAATDARRELDRLRDDVGNLHGRARTGARVDASQYRSLQKDLLALAERVGSPFLPKK